MKHFCNTWHGNCSTLNCQQSTPSLSHLHPQPKLIFNHSDLPIVDHWSQRPDFGCHPQVSCLFL